MIIALGVMLVTSLLLVAAFTAANGDIHLSHLDATQKQAYYAALSGVQEYEYKLEENPNYWQTCEGPAGTVPQPENAVERYEVTVLPASSRPKGVTACSKINPFESTIESKGLLAHTFRIEAVGCAGKVEFATCKEQSRSQVSTRKLVATFQVSGFLSYVYFTQYEITDPAALKENVAGCSHYRRQREELESREGFTCEKITWFSRDKNNGPVHTDDAAAICGSPEFGRKSKVPPTDVAEINGGIYDSGCGSGVAPIFNTPTKSFITGPELIPPESDTSLASYVKPENEFEGRTELELKGTTIKVTTLENKKKVENTIPWPTNNLIYVKSTQAGCTYEYDPKSSDTIKTAEEEESCGTVFVHGTYGESLTIGADRDLVINGNILPTGVSEGATPTGTTTLGLIATRYVRVYHPCGPETGEENGPRSLSNPWIYAAILSTSHSFLVDNWQCGKPLGKLNVEGAIAQKFRGPVGTFSGETIVSGYSKEYQYDDRLATEEPPYYLSPLKTGWRIARETAPEGG